jgi:predicted NBD/HSP70 family sugar kinase
MYLLFDIGGTKMRIAASRDGESFGEPKIIATPASYADGIAAFTSAGAELAAGEPVAALIGGIAGPFSEKAHKLVASPNLSDWVGKPFEGDLASAFDAKVYIENDAAMVGLGEAAYGAGRGFDIVAYVTVSTGVNGVRIVNGMLDEKSLGFEIGHQIIDPDQTLVPDAAGIYFEDIVSGNAVERRTGKKPKEVTDPKFWDDMARYLAIGLNNTIDYWSPDALVLGGSMITGDPAIPLDAVERYLKEYFTIIPELPQILKAELADVGGLWGALAYVKHVSEE